MNIKTLTLIWTLAVAAFAAGCSPDCVALCEDRKGCANADKATNCQDSCDFAEKVNDKAACNEQYMDLLDCYDRQEDVCRTGAQCDKKLAEYSDCVAGYCINHAQDCAP